MKITNNAVTPGVDMGRQKRRGDDKLDKEDYTKMSAKLKKVRKDKELCKERMVRAEKEARL